MPSKTFRHNGRWQQWNVPKGVKYVTVTMTGGGSGRRQSGRITGRIKVSGNQTLFIQVGSEGKANNGTKGGAAVFGGGAAGGDGRGGNGGYGGGGASAIRVNGRSGPVRAVAGGAGGDSGDNGHGGSGGADIGEHGSPGNAASHVGQLIVDDKPVTYDFTSTGNSTGGTQIQGGNGGTSAAGPTFNGKNAPNSVLRRGGAGASPGNTNTFGGGGGGGGYYSGGGGQAGWQDEVPGGGGAGGSNYVGGMIGATSEQGEGGTGHGSVTLTWTTPPPANQPPNPPTDVKIGNQPAVDGFITKSTGSLRISAKLSDKDTPKDTVRLVAVYSPTSDFSRQVRRENSALVIQERPKEGKRKASSGRATVVLRGLAQNTRYYVRLYGRDNRGRLSAQYTTINFWTNRRPLAPDLRLPAENATYSELGSVQFEWKHQDPDEQDQGGRQRAFRLRWRRARTATTKAGEWTTISNRTSFDTYVANPGTFAPNWFYDWQVRTQDPQGQWGPWATPQSFFISGASSPPVPLEPIRSEARSIDRSVTFRWRFRDPDPGDAQVKADIRFRPVSPELIPGDWINLLGTTAEPGSDNRWSVVGNRFMPGQRYEWQVRTTDAINSLTSSWSDSAYFWGVSTPSLVGETEVVASTKIEGALGCGHNRVFIYDRGGTRLRGEVTPTTLVRWSRQRDEMQNCLVNTNCLDEQQVSLLRQVQTWKHELVVFRDGERVWEGPITRIVDNPTHVEIEAKDVLGYLYRRIMRQGYNDAYRIVNGEQLGLKSVVQRATQIAMNALAPDDPNLLAYLTSLDFPDDARTSRVVPDFSKMAWEDIDNLAATAGLDYSVAGRRIIFNDTHRPLGRLPEFRDMHFTSPPVITEYGMQLATAFAVTNNNGVYGLAERDPVHRPYGLIEQLASAYGETEAGPETVLTSEARANLERTLTQQAERNIAGRYPPPIVVRVPDNSALSPEAPVSINHLVPGVWMPLRAKGLIRELSQWQKLDLVTVEETPGDGEKVTVTMSPAPNGGADPDADAASQLEE